MVKIYGDPISGNCYKIKLLLELTDQPYEWVDVDVVAKETRTDEFLKMNLNGRVPLAEIAPDTYLPESNAILYYLAQNTDYWPEDSLAQARVLQWMFFEQYSHEPFIATVRYWIYFLKAEEEFKDEINKRRASGYAALDIMEQVLSESVFFGERPSIADISLYAYTHVAHEGHFSLDDYPCVRDWLKRIEELPNYVGMVG